jgi:hypothetical protein
MTMLSTRRVQKRLLIGYHPRWKTTLPTSVFVPTKEII